MFFGFVLVVRVISLGKSVGCASPWGIAWPHDLKTGSRLGVVYIWHGITYLRLAFAHVTQI